MQTLHFYFFGIDFTQYGGFLFGFSVELHYLCGQNQDYGKKQETATTP